MVLQMTPTKKKTTAKKGDKRLKMGNTKFRSLQHFKRYTFIPSCFQGRGWDKLSSDLLGVCEPLIREFYANARLREHEINCWI